MNYDNLIAKYPKLFSKLKYVECNEGWIDIIDLLCTQLEIINSKYSNPEEGIFAAQVKQKYGGLRFYINTEGLSEQDSNLTNDLIQKTEGYSYKTCESCGAPAAQVRKSRYTTLCDKCSITKSEK